MQPFADLNIQEFSQHTATILLHLLGRFPVKQTLYIDDFIKSAQDDFGLKNENYYSLLASVQWLNEEGFIRYSAQVKQEAFDDVVLTSKGLKSLLSKQPSSESLTLADALRVHKEEPTRQITLILEALELI